MLIFGGVYGNLEALRAVYEHARRLGLSRDQVVNTGDAVAYCADAAAVIEFLGEWNPISIAGNVELQLAAGEGDCGCGFNEGSVCDRLSQEWYPYLQSQLSGSHLSWMRGLPRFGRVDCYGFSAAVVHGSFSNTSEYIFKSTPWNLKERELALAGADVVFAGHCGLPFVQSEGVTGRVWANSGALGMPANDGTSRVWALQVTRSSDGVVFETLPIEYDFASAQAKMQGVPALRAYSSTLSSGLWPSCEILPKAELGDRGQALSVVTLTLERPPS